MPDIHIDVPTFSQLTIKRITQYVLQGISTQHTDKYLSPMYSTMTSHYRSSAVGQLTDTQQTIHVRLSLQ